MSLPQIITIISTSLITAIVVIVGVQIILLLKEFRHSLNRLNQVIDTADLAFQRLSQPAATIAGLLEGLKKSNILFDVISNFVNHKSSQQKSEPKEYESFQ